MSVNISLDSATPVDIFFKLPLKTTKKIYPLVAVDSSFDVLDGFFCSVDVRLLHRFSQPVHHHGGIEAADVEETLGIPLFCLLVAHVVVGRLEVVSPPDHVQFLPRIRHRLRFLVDHQFLELAARM